MLLVALISHKHFRPATIVALCLFPPQKETVTTGKGSLVPLDKLKLIFIKCRITVNGFITLIVIIL